MNNDEQKSYYVETTKKFITCLQNGTGPQQLLEEATPTPFNPVSGIPYSGINRLTMAMSAFKDPRWMTEQQLAEQGLKVLPESKPTQLVSFDVASSRPVMNFINAFNAEQVVDMPPLAFAPLNAKPIEVIEELCSKTGATIHHDESTLSVRAVYWSDKDFISLPPAEHVGEKVYSSLLLHELGHWTGHASRLDREEGPFNSAVYDREDLRVEIATWMLSQELGIPHLPDMHHSCDSWIKLLEKDPSELFRVCRDAEQIKKYVLGIDMAKEHEHEKLLDNNINNNMNTLIEKIKTFISVPFKEMKIAQHLGAKWDSMEKSWFIPEGTNLNLFKTFTNWFEKDTQQKTVVLTPEEEFAEQVRGAGLVLNELPAMDGTLHRIQGGAYSGTLGENPSGTIHNFSTGHSISWNYSGHRLPKDEIAKRCENKVQYDIQSPSPALPIPTRSKPRDHSFEL